MDKDKIRFCLKVSGRSLLVAALSMLALFGGISMEIMNKYIAIFLIIVGMPAIFIGMALFIFGFLMPILGQYMYHNIMPEYAKQHYRNSAVWRFILNLPR